MAMTAVSMVLTLVVIVLWLDPVLPLLVVAVVGAGIDGGWLTTLAYERRLAAQGDRSTPVTVVGWLFGAVATGVLVAHALTEESPAPWLAVSWLPIGAKLLWVVHGLWERTALTPSALGTIQRVQQEARDTAAVARARLRAQAATEETRLTAVTGVGARVARVQAETAGALAQAWSVLESARTGEATGRALASVAAPATAAAPGVAARWELPVWGPTAPVSARPPEKTPATPVAGADTQVTALGPASAAPVPEPPAAPATGVAPMVLDDAAAVAGVATPTPGEPLTEDQLMVVLRYLRHSEDPPLSYRQALAAYRAAGYVGGDARIRLVWTALLAREGTGA
ncbi:hypothetical protein [Streptomyces clavuligerus]